MNSKTIKYLVLWTFLFFLPLGSANSEESITNYDTITTEILSLAIGSNGRIGCADSAGVTGIRMDFFNFAAECDTVDSIAGDTRKYLFDGSIIVGGIFDNDTILSNAIYGGGVDESSIIYELTSATGPILDKEIEYWTSGTLTNFDSSIAFAVTYYAPRSTVTYDFGDGDIWFENQHFITKEIKVWSYDGQNHDNIAVGEIIDWDIPSDSGVRNTGEADTLRNLLYCVGAEFEQDTLLECQRNDLRFGGMAFAYFKRYVSDTNTLAWMIVDSIPYGGYHEANARFVTPGWNDNQLYQNMAAANTLTPWTHADPDSEIVDLHSVLTYVFDYDLLAGDTLVFYATMMSVRNADDETVDSTVVRINELTDKAENFTHYFGCCHNLRGDLNGDGIDAGLVDLTFAIQRLFHGGPAPVCDGEGDVNADGSSCDIADLSFLVDKVFRGGPAPYSCGEVPCRPTPSCHQEE